MQKSFDIAVLGSGFAGSLIAMIARRQGRSVVMVDRATHPRFAIGESSTPVADFVLRELASRYDLPRIAPLSRYGSWQQHYPEIGCGLKRGFTYYQHSAGERFVPDEQHLRELAVAASSDDARADTHWVRADVDAFLASEAERMGVELHAGTTVERLEHLQADSPWELHLRRDGSAPCMRARFLIDATGEGGILPKHLGLRDRTDLIHTNSEAVFSHFRDLPSWHDFLSRSGAKLDDYPFRCDDAAQHHLLDRGWIWMLRFQKNLASVGIAFMPDGTSGPGTDAHGRDPRLCSPNPDEAWRAWLDRYPSVAELLAPAKVAATPGRMIRAGRLQRRWEKAVGDDWALLPHTYGFIDPLHSTGIAFSLCGVERLANVLGQHWQQPSCSAALRRYEHAVEREFEMIDRLVHGCYLTLGHFSLFTAYAMLYFVAATTYERRRIEQGFREDQFFLAADEDRWNRLLRELHLEVIAWHRSGCGAWPAFPERVKRAIEPYNHVGLFDANAHNMYQHTAPQK
ncbi:MAG: hypothetical protein RIS70_3633 [Planctomycetota bacterium]|jgi:FADH2 O2-dependent halogenase